MIIYKVRDRRSSKTPHCDPLPQPLAILSFDVLQILLTVRQLQDIVSGDEIISDTWNLKEKDDAVYEIDCKKITKKQDNVGEWADPAQLRPTKSPRSVTT